MNLKRLHLLPLTLLLIGLPPARTPADVVILKNGNQVQGIVVQEGRRHLTVQIPNGLLRIPRREVLRIESESRHDYLVAEAQKSNRRREFSGAIEHYQNALREDPESKEAQEGLLAATESLARYRQKNR